MESAIKIKPGALGWSLAAFGVPPGWRPTRIAELVRVVGGGTPDRALPAYWENGTIPWVTPTDITAQQRKIISDSAERITQLGLEASNCRLLPPGTIIFTTRATIGSLTIAG